MYRGIRAVLMAVLVVSSLWVGIGLGIASTERKPSAEVRSIGENRIEIWKGGVVVIWTTQENVTNWGDYIIVKESRMRILCDRCKKQNVDFSFRDKWAHIEYSEKGFGKLGDYYLCPKCASDYYKFKTRHTE